MPLNEEDLLFNLEIEPDAAKLQQALAELAAQVEAAGKKGGKALADELARGLQQAYDLLPEGYDQSRPTYALRPEGPHAQAEAIPNVYPSATALPAGSIPTVYGKQLGAFGKLGSAGGRDDVWQNLKQLIPEGGLGKTLSTAAGASVGRGVGGFASGIVGPELGGLLGQGAGQLASAAGPAGVLVAALPAIAKAVGGLAAAPVQLAGKGLDALSGGLRELQGNLSIFGAGLGAIQGAGEALTGLVKKIPLLGDVLGPLGEAVTGLVGPAREILSSLVSMSRLASPGTFYQWNLATEDLQASIGQTFVPLLQQMTEGVNLANDVLSTILPNEEEMADALTAFKNSLAEFRAELRAVLAEHGPALRGTVILGIKMLGQALSFLVNQISTFVRVVTGLARPLIAAFHAIGIGQAGDHQGEIRHSFAAREARIQGLDEYQRQLQLSALGRPGGEDPLNNINVNVQGIGGTLGDIHRVLQNSNTALWSIFAILSPAGAAVPRVIDAAGGPNNVRALGMAAGVPNWVLDWLPGNGQAGR